MSRSEGLPTDDLGQVPAFELACIYDEPEHPSAVTIFDPNVGDMTTRWITADLDSSVSLDELA